MPDILEATPEEGILRSDIVDRDPAERWGEGRVTLLGDAAHPMTPNLALGACTAIEDGIVLARHVAGDHGDIPSALRAYERERMPRTAKFTRQSRRIGAVNHWRHPVAATVRDAVMTFGLHTFARRPPERDLAFDG